MKPFARMMEWLQEPPGPLTSRQRRLLWITTALVAATRLAALAASLWDWDEVLFCRGVRDFEVDQHNPHPPGFPLYIALAKIANLVIGSEFRSLQAITAMAAIALFPLTFFLARELRLPFLTAWLGALLFVFFPNVWFYGSTAFSDVPALALTLAACVALLRGCRHRRAYIAGCLLLGLAASIRPQMILVGALPALVATWWQWQRSHRDVALAVVAGLLPIAVFYGGAAVASGGVTPFLQALAQQRQYVREVDSFMNPTRPALKPLATHFFLRASGGGDLSQIVVVLAALSLLAALIRRRWNIWLLIGMFAPLGIMSWLMLDAEGSARYAVSYALVLALLAADGAARISSHFRYSAVWTTLLAGGLAAAFAFWTIPAIAITRARVAPTVAAMDWIRTTVPTSNVILVHGSMAPFADFFLRKSHAVEFLWEGVPLATLDSRPAWYLVDRTIDDVGAMNFQWERGRLWEVVRKRYFQISVRPLHGRLRFGEGWYVEEPQPGNQRPWRWMGARSITTLPPAPSRARLGLRVFVPVHAMKGVPNLEVLLNGKTLERFPVTAALGERSWDVDTDPRSSNVLELRIDRVVNPAREGLSADSRDLGLNLERLLWLDLKK